MLIAFVTADLILAVICAADEPSASQGFHETVIDTGNWILSQFTDTVEIDPDLVRQLPPPDEWPQFWTRVEEALGSDSPVQLAWLKPEVELAVKILERVPEYRPYAKWLSQRMDYVALADEAMQGVPEARAQLRTFPPTMTNDLQRRLTLVPPPLPPKSAIANETVFAEAKIGKRLGDTLLWKHRLRNRPVPAGADALIPPAKAAFRKEGVPEELAWIAEVESSVDPEARSPVGAVGMFQFMPATAKRFGLQTGIMGDDRKDPTKSATAAAQYLKYLHGKFGTWPLAVAAYNAGEGRVAKAMQRKKADTFDGIADALPVETRMYVPKVAAVMSLREGRDMESLPAPK